ncbi:hypothetical protein B0T22DRAFT_310878 [Podospora appendiculata]|uniref:Uncharacterized protein n=1 Tax=Podospora appendiculata TaxID=314037 RepID=A0AAE1C768_9PEZI|nr:hypothetical protein B0T22DRAFT_310878 [Podospora appendiculata]
MQLGRQRRLASVDSGSSERRQSLPRVSLTARLSRAVKSKRISLISPVVGCHIHRVGRSDKVSLRHQQHHTSAATTRPGGAEKNRAEHKQAFEPAALSSFCTSLPMAAFASQQPTSERGIGQTAASLILYKDTGARREGGEGSALTLSPCLGSGWACIEHVQRSSLWAIMLPYHHHRRWDCSFRRIVVSSYASKDDSAFPLPTLALL